MLYNLKHSKQFSINEKYSKLFGLRCKLTAVLILIGSYTFPIIACIIAGGVVTISYFDTYVSHSLIFTIIWYINVVIVAGYTPALMFMCGWCLHIFVLYIKIRFKQVLDLIAIYHKNSKSFKLTNIKYNIYIQFI
jgi:hypothetical protein